jgi:hypothetical protein
MENKIIKNKCHLYGDIKCVKKDDMIDNVEFIYNNLNKLSDNEINMMHNKIFYDTEKKKRELLFYELENHKIEQINNMSRNKFIIEAKKMLIRYQPCVNKYYEDNVWKLYNHEQTKYELDEHVIIFDNSVSSFYDNECDELKNYTKLMTSKIRQICDNVIVKFVILEDDEHEICWHVIKCKFM